MKLTATHRSLVSSGCHLPALCLTILLALALDSSVTLAVGMHHGGGGFGGGHVGGGGFAGGHSGGFGGGHVGGFGGSFGGGRFGSGGFVGGHVGSFGGGRFGSFGGGQFRGGRFGAGHFAGGQFGGRQFGRFPGGFHNFSDDRFFFRHGHGFNASFAFGFPVVGPYYGYSSYPYYADPYCDPYSPWYNPSYCYWRYRAY